MKKTVLLFSFLLSLSSFTYADTIYQDYYNFGKFNDVSTVKYPVSLSFVAGKKGLINVSEVKIDEKIALRKRMQKINQDLRARVLQGLSSVNFQKTFQKTVRKVKTKKIKEVEVYFNFDSYELKESEKRKLENVVKEGKQAVVYGYADCTGSEKYNLELSQKRAKAVAEFLKSKGIEVKEVQGKGELSESDVNCLNRKVKVILTGR